MNIDEAIEILNQLPYQGEGCLDGKTVAALKLGTEALKYIDLARRSRDVRIIDKLPGETKE